MWRLAFLLLTMPGTNDVESKTKFNLSSTMNVVSKKPKFPISNKALSSHLISEIDSNTMAARNGGLTGLSVAAGGSGLARLAPQFVAEPPALVRYAVASGARLRCSATGDPPPVLAWIADDNVPIEDRPGIRRVYSNGTLEVLPSPEARAGAPTVLRCRAANAHGVAFSREVTLQPVSDTGWEAVVSAGAVAAGGVAAVTCAASGAGAGLVAPALWYRGDQVIDHHRPSPESRYLVAGDTLLIRDVGAADAGPYSCLARHALTAHTRRATPQPLTVTQGRSNSAPRLVAAAGEVTAAAGALVCLPCASADHPPPHYTWYRESGGRLQPVEASGAAWVWAGGAALCLRATPTLAGAWLCKAYNVYGDATAQVRLHVQDTLTVTATPSVVVADSGSTVRLNCNASDPAARLSWLHDGAAASAGGELVLRGVARAHRGLYQCVARRGTDNAHADVELRLGDSAPELHYTFIEQALRAGGAVSLRCAATGAPPPRFQWLLDAQPIDQHRTQHRYSISEETSANGDVVSTLNVSAASAADGGRYTCRAHNDLGHAEHSARLNIYGPPSIRALGPVRVVAGANATVFCPYAGYPISSVVWWAREAGRAVDAAGRVSARGAELRLRPALPPDAGHYACAVSAPGGAAARRDIEIQVRNPPKISPFMFSSELTEGSSVQVLCGVSSGDKPMYFSWLKDGAPLPSNLQIEEKSLNEFSLLMFSDLSARHSGDYTCRVSNHAATVNYTATLSVKVAPAWVKEPLDTAVLLGAPLNVECAAKGYPIPIVSWYRKIGDGTSLVPESSEQWQLIESMMWEEKSRSGTHTAVRAQNGSLTADVASRNHQGVYRCLADNGVGPPLMKHINLTVHEPAHFEESGGNVSSVRGQSASLTCHALGDAPLTVHWTHMGTRLDLNSYRWTVSEVRTADGLRSVLQLRAAERVDAGEYRCHAHNQFGRSEVLMYLHVEEPPEAPRSIRLGGVGPRWVRLAWRSGPGPGIYYNALFTALHALPGVESKHTTTNLTLDSLGNDRLDADGLRSLSARLDGLRPAAAYSLRLAAANHVGQSPHSDPILFTTLEEPPTASPQNVRVRPASIGELHVSWSAPPQDGWNGELLGYVVSWRELSHFEEEGGEARRSGAATSPGWSSGELAVGGLRSFARYAVIVRAYNRAGAGPPSPTVYATTADGVPEVPPTSVFCEGVSARAVRVRWAQPPPAAAHALRGYQLQYAPLQFSPAWSGAAGAGAGVQTARAGAEAEATLQGLRAATNYSVWVRARTDAGLGPPAPPVYCATTDDVPGAPEVIRALPMSSEAVRVSWLPPAEHSGRVTHYTLYTRELGKVGGEWSQRVESGAEAGASEAGSGEAWREVTGLRERTVYEFWVRAATVAGAGPPSRAVTAAPATPVGVRILSIGRVVWAAVGARVRLRCAAVGAPPLRWRWSPPSPHHTVTDTGDLIIHKAESSGNYTCSVRGSGGTDSAQFAVVVRAPPAAPALRLLRADRHALHLAWEPPRDNGAPVLGYTIWWSEVSEVEARRERWVRVAGGEVALWLRGLACGALYRVQAQAHNALGASSRCTPLLARTLGDKAKAAPGKEFVWANSSSLRVNLLAWRARCPVAAWAVALRPAAPTPTATWTDLPADGESALANNLRPGTWYEIRVVARSAAGDTAALYRAATLTVNGERVGEPVEMPLEARRANGADGAAAAGAAAWRAGLAPLLMAAVLAALLAAVAGVAVVRRRAAACARSCSPPPRAHPQLYTTEPGKRNGKALTPPDNDLHEISPYATFSMAGGCTGPGAGAGAGAGAGGSAGGCALHLRTFGRAEPLDLAAPPPRPNLLSHGNEYGRGRDSDSESSGSPCAACAAELYRLPAARLADTLPAVESSAEDTSYSASGRGACSARATRGVAERGERSERSERGERGRQPRGRRRRDHSRHTSAPTVRYFAAGAPLQPRQEVL